MDVIEIKTYEYYVFSSREATAYRAADRIEERGSR